MNVNDKDRYEARIKELEERNKYLESEYKWLWSVFQAKMGVVAK
jgi:hypothetical protein